MHKLSGLQDTVGSVRPRRDTQRLCSTLSHIFGSGVFLWDFFDVGSSAAHVQRGCLEHRKVAQYRVAIAATYVGWLCGRTDDVGRGAAVSNEVRSSVAEASSSRSCL
jgi:hypothetical protein